MGERGVAGSIRETGENRRKTDKPPEPENAEQEP